MNYFSVNMRKIGFILLIFIIFLFILEGSFRLYFIYNNPNPNRIVDEYLGWKNIANFKHTFDLEGIGIVNFSNKKNGFRKWGSPKTTKTKLLIIGDSYTSAQQISDGKCYYNYIDSSKFEVFAFGCSGFGTLQEFLVVEKYKSIISPDLIIWQFCHNDLINNNYELEKLSYMNNSLIKKPFLIDDNIKYKYPQKQALLGVIEKYSKVALWVHIKLNTILYDRYGSIEEKLNSDTFLYNKAILTSKKIYSRISVNHPNSIIFSVSTSFGYKEIESICKETSLPFIKSVHQNYDSINSLGIKLNYQPYDWHWNEKGHRIVGETLNKELNLIFTKQNSL